MTDKPAPTALRPYSDPAPGALAIAHDRWPSFIVAQSPRAEQRFLEFFTAQIRNKKTRETYFEPFQDSSTGAKSVASHWTTSGRAMSPPTLKGSLSGSRTPP